MMSNQIDHFRRSFGDKLIVAVVDDLRELPKQVKCVSIFQDGDPDGDWQIDFPLTDVSKLITILKEIEAECADGV